MNASPHRRDAVANTSPGHSRDHSLVAFGSALFMATHPMIC
jgi:hypothetical protein